jgi:hypothetical protein
MDKAEANRCKTAGCFVLKGWCGQRATAPYFEILFIDKNFKIVGISIV